MANSNIFVSYARADTDYVIKLSTELRDAGADLWLDQLDIPVGATWDLEIENALAACNCLLFIVSQKSAASNNVLNEVYYALEQNKRVLPVKINDCKIPFRIQRLQYIDLSNNYQDGFKHLLKTLNLATISKTDNPKSATTSNTSSDPDQKLKIQAEHEAKEHKEENLWHEAEVQNTIAAYKDYLRNTELKKYWAKAEAAIVKLNRYEQEKLHAEWIANQAEAAKPSGPSRISKILQSEKKKDRIIWLLVILAIAVGLIISAISSTDSSTTSTESIPDSTTSTISSDTSKMMSTDTSSMMMTADTSKMLTDTIKK